MTFTVKGSTSAEIADQAFATSKHTVTMGDSVASSHDYVDETPRVVSTAGAVGTTLVQLETPVRQVERLLADFLSGTDILVRFDGLPASVLGNVSTPSISGSETLVLNVDGVGNVTTVLDAGDTTILKIAERINFFHRVRIASVDTSGVLKLLGLLTGGADAKARGFSYGSISVVSGSGLSALGLTAGITYGSVESDIRQAAGRLERTFPASALPRKIELSGSCTASRFIVAGKSA